MSASLLVSEQSISLESKHGELANPLATYSSISSTNKKTTLVTVDGRPLTSFVSKGCCNEKQNGSSETGWCL